MVVSNKSCIIRGKLGVFEQGSCIRSRVVAFGEKWFYSGKVIVIGQKKLYSCKSGCLRVKVDVIGQMCL